MKPKSKTTAVGGVAVVIAVIFQVLTLFGIDVAPEEQAKVITGSTALAGIILGYFAQSPVQDKIDKKKSQGNSPFP